MATVSKELAKEIIKLNGYYEDDPRVYSVIKYSRMDGRDSFAITYSESDEARYRPTEFVRNPIVIWRSDKGVMNPEFHELGFKL